MTALTTIEALAELERQLVVSDDENQYLCGRCGRDYHLSDERNEPSALCDACAQEVVENELPALLATARAHLELTSALEFISANTAERLRESDISLDAQLLTIRVGDDPVPALLKFATELGWSAPKGDR